MCVYTKACTHLSLSVVAYSTPGSTAPNRFVGIGTRDNFLNIPQQTQVPHLLSSFICQPARPSCVPVLLASVGVFHNRAFGTRQFGSEANRVLESEANFGFQILRNNKQQKKKNRRTFICVKAFRFQHWFTVFIPVFSSKASLRCGRSPQRQQC